MTTKSSTPNFRGAVLWELKLNGNVNETHAGGNAVKALHERIVSHGFKGLKDSRHLGKILYNLSVSGHIKIVKQGNKIYAIRLTTHDDKLPDSPYGSYKKPIEVALAIPEIVDPSDSIIDDLKTLPLSRRAHIVKELSASISEDMDSFKAGVAGNF